MRAHAGRAMATILRVFASPADLDTAVRGSRAAGSKQSYTAGALPLDAPSFVSDVSAHLTDVLWSAALCAAGPGYATTHATVPTLLREVHGSQANVAGLRRALEAALPALATAPSTYLAALGALLRAEAALLEAAYAAADAATRRVVTAARAAARAVAAGRAGLAPGQHAPPDDAASLATLLVELSESLGAAVPESFAAAQNARVAALAGHPLQVAAALAPPVGAPRAWVETAALAERAAASVVHRQLGARLSTRAGEALDEGSREAVIAALRGTIGAAVSDTVRALEAPAAAFIAARAAWCDGPAAAPQHGVLASQVAFLGSADIAHWFLWSNAAAARCAALGGCLT